MLLYMYVRTYTCTYMQFSFIFCGRFRGVFYDSMEPAHIGTSLALSDRLS